jgi:hypothetical protein
MISLEDVRWSNMTGGYKMPLLARRVRTLMFRSGLRMITFRQFES